MISFINSVTQKRNQVNPLQTGPSVTKAQVEQQDRELNAITDFYG